MWVVALTAVALSQGIAIYVTSSTAWAVPAILALTVLCAALYEFEKRVRRPRA
jgi:hypothetical protein